MAPNLNTELRLKFLNTIRILKREFPTAYPVYIRTRKKWNGYYGLMEFKDGKNPHFVITLRRESYGVMLDCLFHEWAHARTFSLVQKELDVKHWHDESWAVEYSKIIRHFYENAENYKEISAKMCPN